MTGSLVVALVLLAVNGVIGAVDTLWYHEWKGRLPVAGGGVRAELALHAGRDAVYAVVYGTLPWLAWQGWWAGLLAALLLVELVITFCDFAVEARVRVVGAGERILHTAMGIVYGAAMAALVPVLVERAGEPASMAVRHDGTALPLRWALTIVALGIVASGVRDAVAAVAGPRAGRPWPVPAGA